MRFSRSTQSRRKALETMTKDEAEVITRYSDLHCGGGKTLFAIGELTAREQQSILAVDRREVVQDRIAALRAAAMLAGTTPLIIPIVTPQEAPTGLQEGVRRLIADAPEAHAAEPHVILIVTHQGLLSADLGYYDGWRVWIDEIPSILQTVSFPRNPATMNWMRSSYDVEPIAEGVSRIVDRKLFSLANLTSSRPNPNWIILHQMVMTGEARVHASTWDDLAERDGWIAWRITNLADRLATFDQVSILGDALHDHTTGQLLSRQPDIDLQPLIIPPRHGAQPFRPVISESSISMLNTMVRVSDSSLPNSCPPWSWSPTTWLKWAIQTS